MNEVDQQDRVAESYAASRRHRGSEYERIEVINFCADQSEGKVQVTSTSNNLQWIAVAHECLQPGIAHLPIEWEEGRQSYTVRQGRQGRARRAAAMCVAPAGEWSGMRPSAQTCITHPLTAVSHIQCTTACDIQQ